MMLYQRTQRKSTGKTESLLEICKDIWMYNLVFHALKNLLNSLFFRFSIFSKKTKQKKGCIVGLGSKTVRSIPSAGKIHTVAVATRTHICVGREQIRGPTCAHFVTLQSNYPFANVHTRVEWALCNYDIAPEKKENTNTMNIIMDGVFFPTKTDEMAEQIYPKMFTLLRMNS